MKITRTAGRAVAALACSAVLALGTAAPAFADDPVPPPPPDKDCSEISETDFQVSPGDPHRFDADGDGIGCESGEPPAGDNGAETPPAGDDKNCADVARTNFPVSAGDPNNFDADGDGIGCETGDGAPPAGDDAGAGTDDDTQQVDVVPEGGVSTGGGGTADRGVDAGLLGVGSALVLAAGGLVVARRLRRNS